MLDFSSAMQVVGEALSAEAGCTPEQLVEPGVRLLARPDEGGPRLAAARRLRPNRPSFSAVSLGDGVVVSASRELLPALAPLFEQIERDQAFEPERLATVSGLLRPHGLWIRGPGTRLVCGQDTLTPHMVPDDFRMVVEPDPPIERVRELGSGQPGGHEPDGRAPGSSAWPNAIDDNQFSGALPTTVLAVGYGDGRVVGVAAATAEAPRLWQIGLDVAAEARGRGLGTALVAAVAQHVVAAGRVPWYAVAPANLRSLRAAVSAGFHPAWLEVRAVARPHSPDSAAP